MTGEEFLQQGGRLRASQRALERAIVAKRGGDAPWLPPLTELMAQKNAVDRELAALMQAFTRPNR